MTHVGWDEGRLDRREVIANYGGGGILVSHLNGPDTGASADVEYPAWRSGDGGEMQCAAEGEEEEVMVQVHVISHWLVVGSPVRSEKEECQLMYEVSSYIRRRGERQDKEIPVCPFAKSVVATAILVIVVPNVGVERSGQRLRVFVISRVGVVATGGEDGALSIDSRRRVCHWIPNW